MSIETEFDFSEIIEIGSRQNNAQPFGRTVTDRGFGPIPASSFDKEETEYSDDTDREDNDFEWGSNEQPASESLLPYDYEMDTVDALNLDEQIASYAADFWEFVSIIGDTILFKRPKGMI